MTVPVGLCGCETWFLTTIGEYRSIVYENRMLRIIYGAKGEEVAGEWRRLHSEELHKLSSSPNFIRAIKSKWMRRAGHETRMDDMRNHKTYWSENLKERDLLEDLCVNIRIISEIK
jgi:hypothetical protein